MIEKVRNMANMAESIRANIYDAMVMNPAEELSSCIDMRDVIINLKLLGMSEDDAFHAAEEARRAAFESFTEALRPAYEKAIKAYQA